MKPKTTEIKVTMSKQNRPHLARLITEHQDKWKLSFLNSLKHMVFQLDNLMLDRKNAIK